MTEKKKLSFGTILFYIIPIAAISAAIFFGYLFLREYMEYKRALDEYAEISESYIKEPSGNGDDKKYPDGNENESGVIVGDADSRLNYFPELDIDFSGLKKVNPDLACVLYIPSLEIKYPVVYSKDNEDYLHRTFEGNSNSSGSIFYDCICEKNFKGYNTFLYGHNMKNGSMFGKLKKLQDRELSPEDRFFYIYTDNEVRKYEIFSYYQTTAGSDVYTIVSDDKAYDAFVRSCLNSSYSHGGREDIDFTHRPSVVTLSTCTGPAGGDDRFVVHGALIKMK